MPGSVRAQVIARDGNKCAYCGKRAGSLRCDGKGLERLTLDHVVPRSQGGSNHPSNLVPCCHACNNLKGARLVEEWKPDWIRPCQRTALLKLVDA